MTYIASKEFLLEVEKGNVPGHEIWHMSGRAVVANAGWRVVSDQIITGAAPIPEHLTTAVKMRVKAGNVNNDVAGTHARKITVTGLDSNFLLVTEDLVTAGASAGADGTTDFIRVIRARVKEVGTYGLVNTGALIIEDVAAAMDMVTISSLVGSTLNGMFTIPASRKGYVLNMHAQVGTAGDCRLLAFQRKQADDSSSPVAGKQVLYYAETVGGPLTWDPEGSIVLPEKTDFWFETFGAAASTIQLTCSILLINDGS